MGYQLNGPVLERDKEQELLSFGVNRGAIQLLPNGQLIILMADHQVTGGYPVIGYVISADLPQLAQWGTGKKFTFSLSSLYDAEQAEEAQRRDRRLEQFYCSEKWKQIDDHQE
jgi:antagonist of KipI